MRCAGQTPAAPIAVSAVGDATGLPTRAELERVLAGGGDVVR